jgi:hypothetical protein
MLVNRTKRTFATRLFHRCTNAADELLWFDLQDPLRPIVTISALILANLGQKIIDWFSNEDTQFAAARQSHYIRSNQATRAEEEPHHYALLKSRA